MKYFAIVFMGLFLFNAQIARAQYDLDEGFDVPVDDPSDGDFIPEPVLADFHNADRVPGFSVAYDIVDANGQPSASN